eukprot:9449122-Alexandrium_andersonii.AAC.1
MGGRSPSSPNGPNGPLRAEPPFLQIWAPEAPRFARRLRRPARNSGVPLFVQIPSHGEGRLA